MTVFLLLPKQAKSPIEKHIVKKNDEIKYTEP